MVLALLCSDVLAPKDITPVVPFDNIVVAGSEKFGKPGGAGSKLLAESELHDLKAEFGSPVVAPGEAGLVADGSLCGVGIRNDGNESATGDIVLRELHRLIEVLDGWERDALIDEWLVKGKHIAEPVLDVGHESPLKKRGD